MSKGLRRIHWKPWLTLREAASLVGRELIGQDWSDPLLDRSPDDPLLRDIARDLYAAISSGEVTALITDGGRDRHVLQPVDTRKLSFELRLAKSWVQILDKGDFWFAEVNASELEAFLKRHRANRFQSVPASERKSQCLQWLCQEMRRGPKWPKRDCLAEAKRRFGISERDFNHAWSEADSKTGAGWSKPGRPKSA